MIGAVHEHRRLEPRLAVGEAEALVLREAIERGNVTVVRAVNQQVVVIAHWRRLVGWPVLPIHRCDRHQRLDIEIEIEFHRGVVGIVRQTIERARHGHRFTTARVPHQRDVAHVHLAPQWRSRGVVEASPRLQMLEQHPAARVVLATDVAVQEVFIDRRHDVAARREQFAQIPITGIGELLHVVIAVHHQHERKRARRIGIPHAPVHRHLGEIEAPILLADSGLPRVGCRRELGAVHDHRFQRDRVAIDRALPVGAAAVVESLHREATLQRRVRRGQQLTRQHRIRIVACQFERRHAGARHQRSGEREPAELRMPGAPPFSIPALHDDREEVRNAKRAGHPALCTLA